MYYLIFNIIFVMGMLKTILQSIQEYCETSTLHGLPLVVAKNRHILERVFWIANVILAVIGVIALCLSNWQRYVENPTVVSLEKDFRNWHNPFPAATGCFIMRTDEDLTNRYIKKQWKIDETHEKYEYYLNFIKAVANISYESMYNFTEYLGDKTLDNIDLLDLAIQVHPPLTGDLVTFDVKRKSNWDIIVTEFGLCFSTNSKLIDLFVAQKKNKTKEEISNESLLECHYLNGLCYARYDSDPYLSIRYFVHSPYEVIHTTATAPLLLPEKAELEINYRMQETRPAASLRRLSVSQRQCRFYDEPMSSDMPAYATSICHIMCRYRNALKFCGCRPYFYHRLGGKVCDIAGMVCLSKHTDFFTQNSNKMGCNCLEPCRVITYFPQAQKMTEWVSGYFDQRVTFRWGLLHPTTRFHRDILFGFEDLVVSFGGTASLFFGMSFLTIVELIFFIIRKIVYIFYRKKSEKNNITPIQIKSSEIVEVKPPPRIQQAQNSIYRDNFAFHRAIYEDNFGQPNNDFQNRNNDAHGENIIYDNNIYNKNTNANNWRRSNSRFNSVYYD